MNSPTQFYLHNFIVPSINELGFNSFRGTLHNKHESLCHLYVAERNRLGALEKNFTHLGTINKGNSKIVEIESSEHTTYVFSLVPEKYNYEKETKIHDINLRDLIVWSGKIGHYVEYYNDYTSTGIDYQVPPLMNYSSHSFLCHIPKVLISSSFNTHIQLIAHSLNKDFCKAGTIHCMLYDKTGRVLTWVEKIYGHGVLKINIKDVLERNNTQMKGFLYFKAFSNDISCLEMTYNHNEDTGALAFEHSLSPYYYEIDLDRRNEVISQHIEKFNA